MNILEATTHPEVSETYLIILVDGEDKPREVVPRCLGNFDNYTVLGVLQATNTYSTYSLFATPNLPELYLTIPDGTPPEYLGKVIEIDSATLSKAIEIRAKDVKFSLKKVTYGS